MNPVVDAEEELCSANSRQYRLSDAREDSPIMREMFCRERACQTESSLAEEEELTSPWIFLVPGGAMYANEISKLT